MHHPAIRATKLEWRNTTPPPQNAPLASSIHLRKFCLTHRVACRIRQNIREHWVSFRAYSGYPNIRSSGCLLRPMDIRSSGCRGGGIHTSFVEVRPAASGGIGPSHSSFTTTNQLLISASVELFWLIIAQQS